MAFSGISDNIARSEVGHNLVWQIHLFTANSFKDYNAEI